ncbi:mannitol-1-phosphate 5-dehydrogenase [Zophobihabitans entericus]|uniref:Mannitol-1-phosphate 5-dehydrogenase n=1 Tax=Zophobihabitans entericus TaxID=1635327 RepID=A0A6G9IAH3_9GAMM|nr:mannitol-1-phosphate 5-dehydrogenase [Zophobihabitans entericus]QIQ20580.1 mannitol-1-phosphate 5-dehydrogenase [Zophobihabitans entericus]
MNVIHFGAGNIGKGFIANVLSHNGFHICFVDVDQTNIATIRKENKYLIEVLDTKPYFVEVNNVSILDSIHEQTQIVEQICQADLITTSVGVNNLPRIAPLIIQGLIERFKRHRTPVNIIANENAINATNILKQAITQQLPTSEQQILTQVGFVNSAIDRQAISTTYNGTTITAVEPFWEWVINQKEMVENNLPKIQGVTYVDDLQPYIEKKLYIVNLGHASLAYLGFIANKTTILDVLSIPVFRQFVKNVMSDSARYLIAEYQFAEQTLADYIEDTLSRFANPHIKDSVLRVAKSPIRKLGVNERLIGPLSQLQSRKLPTHNLSKVVAMALLFSDQQDSEAITLQDFIQQHGIEAAIKHYCQITDQALIQVIADYYTTLNAIIQNDSGTHFLTRIEHFLFNQ